MTTSFPERFRANAPRDPERGVFCDAQIHEGNCFRRNFLNSICDSVSNLIFYVIFSAKLSISNRPSCTYLNI